MGGGRAGSQFVAVFTAAHLPLCLSQPVCHHSAANAVSGGISIAPCRGAELVAAGKAVRPPPGEMDVRIPMAEWNMPTPPRGSVAAGIGAARAKRSRAYSPTATAGSRAALIIIKENVYDMADSFLTAESQECLRLRVTRMMSALRAVEIFAMVATVML